MDSNRKRICRVLAALAICAAMTGCGGQESSLTASSHSSADSAAATAYESTPAEESFEVTHEQTIDSTGADTAEATAPPVQDIEQQTAEDSSDATQETTAPDLSYETEDRDAPVDPQPPEQTSTVQTTSPPPVTTTTEPPATTTEKPPEKPPAEVVIPNVRMPASPNIEVISAECAVIDVSNAADGYISVTYSGSAPKVKLRIEYGDTKYNHNVPVDGTTEYFPLSCGSGEYKITLYENAEANLYSTAAEGNISVKIKSDTSPFLYPNCYVKFDKSSQCVKKGAELCAGLTEDIEKIAAIFTYVAQSTSYDKALAASAPSGYVPYPDRTLKEQKGICYDYASLFAAMTRSQGIPTRLCIGYAAPEIYHAWNEVYTEETGWITPELFLSRKGYNLVDATFYSGAADKSQISEYISNGANYSVIYYY